MNTKSLIYFYWQKSRILSQFLSKKKYSTIFILVDTHTEKYCLPTFLIKNPLYQLHKIITIDAGEEHKTLDTCRLVWEKLLEENADKHSLLINLGGGVVTDLGGFVAATYKRGIDFIHMPTTLLAMVDAAIGGKTGVDFRYLKNQIGVIVNPKAILIDEFYLQTLPEREFKSGYAEMLKHGLIADVKLWNTLKKYPKDTKDIPSLIEKSTAIKEKVVKSDLYETGKRKILNFGHTLGHAIETYFLNSKKARLLHGEAIAIGMILESYLSVQKCNFSKENADEIKRYIKSIYTNVKFEQEDIVQIIDLLKHDKKNKKSAVLFVLLKKIGKPVIDIEIKEKALFQEAFKFYSAD